jgi:hypothetical protein
MFYFRDAESFTIGPEQAPFLAAVEGSVAGGFSLATN